MASDNELQNVLPELIQRKDALRNAAKAKGITFTIAPDGGLRTAARNAQLVKYRDDEVSAAKAKAKSAALQAGLSPADTAAVVEKAGTKAYYRVSPNSYHMVGAAFDIAIVHRPPGMSWEDGYHTVAELAKPVGLRSGWYFPAPRDVFHFELREPRSVYAVQFAAMNKQTALATAPRVLPVVLLVAALGLVYYYGA